MTTDKWKENISGGFVFTKKGQFQVDFIQAKILSGQIWRKTRRNEWLTGRDWHSYSILVLSSGNWRHIQTHKLYHPWLSLLNVWSSHNISLLSRWYISLIDQSHWHRRSQVVSKAARNKRAGVRKQVHRLSSARQLRELSSALRHTHLLCAGPPVHWSNQHKKATTA